MYVLWINHVVEAEQEPSSCLGFYSKKESKKTGVTTLNVLFFGHDGFLRRILDHQRTSTTNLIGDFIHDPPT
jgi:hypothetical protein